LLGIADDNLVWTQSCEELHLQTAVQNNRLWLYCTFTINAKNILLSPTYWFSHARWVFSFASW